MKDKKPIIILIFIIVIFLLLGSIPNFIDNKETDENKYSEENNIDINTVSMENVVNNNKIE